MIVKMSSTKICITSNTSWSIYNFRLGLIRTLKKNGNKIIIVAPLDKYSEPLGKEFELYKIDIDSKGTIPVKDLKTFFSYYKLYRKIRWNWRIN